MVPSGWNTLALSEITKEKISYGIVQAGPNVKDGIPYIKSADVGGEIDVESLQRTAKEIHHKYRRSSVHPNDIVFSLRGNIARTSIVPTSLQEANLTQGTARISVNDKNDTKFVYYKLASTPILNRINALSKGSTFKEISLEELRKVKLPLPPLPEQRKIAKILSTWDKAISTTERLIVNSKQQKKALMQQLLTGRKRLIDDSGKPFEGEWEEVNLSSLALSGKSNFTDGDWIESPFISESGCRLIQTGNIGVGVFKGKSQKYISESSFHELKCTEVNIGDLLICRLAEPAGRACVVPDLGEEKMLTSVDVTIMKVDINKSSAEFLSHYFSLEHTLYTVSTLCGGSTRSRVSRTNLGKMKVHLPEVNEQKKITSVLTNADKEIELLEQQLADLKQEKKALMQQLLTGKRRVKVDDEAVA